MGRESNQPRDGQAAALGRGRVQRPEADQIDSRLRTLRRISSVEADGGAGRVIEFWKESEPRLHGHRAHCRGRLLDDPGNATREKIEEQGVVLARSEHLGWPLVNVPPRRSVRMRGTQHPFPYPGPPKLNASFDGLAESVRHEHTVDGNDGHLEVSRLKDDGPCEERVP